MMHQALLVMESFNYFTQGPWIVIVVFYSNEHNISNGCFFLLGCSHFCLLCKRGRYSFNHLFQKISARYWTCFHLRRDNRSSLWNKPGGIGGLEHSSTKWLGVKGCLSGKSLKTVLIGQLFIILSTLHIKVVRLLLLWICSWRRAEFSTWCKCSAPIHHWHLSHEELVMLFLATGEIRSVVWMNLLDLTWLWLTDSGTLSPWNMVIVFHYQVGYMIVLW